MTRSDDIITITDVRRIVCVNGARKWAKAQGIDFREFVKNGLPTSQLYGRGDDAIIDRVISARKEATDGRR